MLRQQEAIADGKAEPVAGRLRRAARRAGVADYLGALRRDRRARRRRRSRARFEREHDDYNAIMVKALADRLAEAFAAYLHARAREEWGFGERRRSPDGQIIAEAAPRHPPGFGYPACPDHSEKFKLFDLLEAPSDRHRADRARRDDAGGQRERPVLRASRRRAISPSGASARIRSPATRGAKGCRSTRSSAGCRPTSPTSRRAAERAPEGPDLALEVDFLRLTDPDFITLQPELRFPPSVDDLGPVR